MQQMRIDQLPGMHAVLLFRPARLTHNIFLPCHIWYLVAINSVGLASLASAVLLGSSVHDMICAC